MNPLDAIRFIRLGRSRLREILEWAETEPRQAAILARTVALWLRHRARVLEKRRWAFRKAHRIGRNRSAATALEGLAGKLDEGALADCRRELGE
jgi:hypothetical protein